MHQHLYHLCNNVHLITPVCDYSILLVNSTDVATTETVSHLSEAENILQLTVEANETILWFLPVRRYASAGNSNCNVCPSVTRRYCVKTKKASGMISSPSGSPKTLVF